MTTQHFKDSARSIASHLDRQGISYDVYQLLNLTEALVSNGVSFVDPATTSAYREAERAATHERLVTAALNSHEVLGSLAERKKINAIKALRSLTACGLKEAKDAVEDDRVEASALMVGDPWGRHHDSDEPPF
jgi:ribosomal protein L7/L12